jgi:alpha-L-fucosidase
VAAFAVDGWWNGDWREIAHSTSIGNLRLLRVQEQTTHRVRLRIVQAPVCPAVSELALFASR